MQYYTPTDPIPRRAHSKYWGAVCCRGHFGARAVVHVIYATPHITIRKKASSLLPHRILVSWKSAEKWNENEILSGMAHLAVRVAPFLRCMEHSAHTTPVLGAHSQWLKLHLLPECHLPPAQPGPHEHNYYQRPFYVPSTHSRDPSHFKNQRKFAFIFSRQIRGSPTISGIRKNYVSSQGCLFKIELSESKFSRYLALNKRPRPGWQWQDMNIFVWKMACLFEKGFIRLALYVNVLTTSAKNEKKRLPYGGELRQRRQGRNFKSGGEIGCAEFSSSGLSKSWCHEYGIDIDENSIFNLKLLIVEVLTGRGFFL